MNPDLLDQAITLDWQDRNSRQVRQNQATTAPKPKGPGGARGALLNFLPTIGGAVGAVGGGIAGGVGGFFGGAGIGAVPGAAIGAAGGGTVGSGLGEYLRQKLSGEAEDGIDKGNIAQEAAFGALPGVVKGVGAVRSAAKGAKGALQAAEATSGATKAAQTTEAALQAKAKQNRLTRFGAGLQDDVRGTAVGTKVSKNTDKSTYLQPKTAKTANADIDTLPGKTPAEKLASLETRQAQAGENLTATVTAGNRATTVGDLDRITAKAGQQSKKIQGWDNEIASEANRTIAGAKSLDELYAVRKDLDDSLQSFYKAAVNDSSATAKAKTLKAYRDGVDEVLSDIPGFKEANKAYSQGLKTQDILNRAASKKNDIRIFGVNTGAGGETIARTKETVGGIARKVGGAGAPPTGTPPSAGGFRPFMGQAAKATIPQAGYRLGSSIAFGTPFVGSEQPAEDLSALPPEMGDLGMEDPSMAPEEDTSSPFAPANVEANIQKILANGGNMKDVTEYMNIVKTMESFKPKPAKPLSAQTVKTQAGAKAGLENLDYLEQIMQEQPSDRTKTAIPGRGLVSGLGNRLLGTDDYEGARQNIIDSWARIKTGAAISQNEERRFKENLPQAFDSERTVQMKMRTLRNLFTSVAENSVGAGTDLESALSEEE